MSDQITISLERRDTEAEQWAVKVREDGEIMCIGTVEFGSDRLWVGRVRVDPDRVSEKKLESRNAAALWAAATWAEKNMPQS